MLLNKKILAVVPARSKSKGVKDKNIKDLGGLSLIARAATCLNDLDWIDVKIISTDSDVYANEGKKYGLDVPFLRPEYLSGDSATTVDTMIHAINESEFFFNIEFDILLVIEPTSPFRVSSDIEGACTDLINSGSDSVVCVSPLDTQCHPDKALSIKDGKLKFYDKKGMRITARQQLDDLYVRNGICYAITKKCLLTKKNFITDNTKPFLVNRYIVNIDTEIDILWAEFLIHSGFIKLNNVA